MYKETNDTMDCTVPVVDPKSGFDDLGLKSTGLEQKILSNELND
jgi:hypothetical protein